MERFERHIQLKGFGKTAQLRLEKAKALVVGAGGLGSPVLMELTAMGVGNIGIIDADVVELSNLHRQLLYDESNIGVSKVIVAQNKLMKMNANLTCQIYNEFLTKDNVAETIANYDIVIDGTDNFETRYLLNDACVLTRKPLVYGAVYEFEGQVSIFNVPLKSNNSAHYRDLFPIAPMSNQVPNCNENGVFGILPQLIGTFMAIETVKFLCGMEGLLQNRMLTYDVRNHNSAIFEYSQSKKNHTMPQTMEELKQFDYQAFCNSKNKEITALQIISKLKKSSDSILVDLRDKFSLPKLDGFPFLKIPFNDLTLFENELKKYNCLIFVCQKGINSRLAVEWASEKWPEKEIFHFKPGANALIKFNENA